MKLEKIKPYVATLACVFLLSLLLSWSPWNKFASKNSGDIPVKSTNINKIDSLEKANKFLLDSLKRTNNKEEVLNHRLPVPSSKSTPNADSLPRISLKVDNGSKGAVTTGNNSPINQTDIYEGVKQRQITAEYLNEILNKTPNKDALIKFYFINQDKESLQYAENISRKLQQLGYKNFFAGSISDPSNTTFDKIGIDRRDEKYTIISVYPSGNIK